MFLKKPNKVADEFELSSNEKSIIQNEKNDSFLKKNKKIIVIFSIIFAVIIIFAGVGVLVGVLVTSKKSSSNESQEITDLAITAFTNPELSSSTTTHPVTTATTYSTITFITYPIITSTLIIYPATTTTISTEPTTTTATTTKPTTTSTIITHSDTITTTSTNLTTIYATDPSTITQTNSVINSTKISKPTITTTVNNPTTTSTIITRPITATITHPVTTATSYSTITFLTYPITTSTIFTTIFTYPETTAITSLSMALATITTTTHQTPATITYPITFSTLTSHLTTLTKPTTITNTTTITTILSTTAITTILSTTTTTVTEPSIATETLTTTSSIYQPITITSTKPFTSTAIICTQSVNYINYTQSSIKVNSSNGTSLSNVLGIIEIMNDTNYFFITDWLKNRVLKLNENGEYIKSITITFPRYITKSQRYIYVNSNWTSIIKLNSELVQISTVINNHSIDGIHYDLSNDNIYAASWSSQLIYIYHTNDEILFTKIATISSSYQLASITINNDRIYTGTSNGTILVYSKSNYSLIQVMNNMCPNTFIESVKFDCSGNMIYSCENPPMVKIITANGINTTLLLNDTFSRAYETYIDSKNRLWVGGNRGFIVF